MHNRATSLPGPSVTVRQYAPAIRIGGLAPRRCGVAMASSLRPWAEFDLLSPGDGSGFVCENSGESENACTAFGNYGGVAFCRVRFIGRLWQRPARRCRSSGSARSQRRRRSRGSGGSPRAARPCRAAGSGGPTEPEHPGGEIGLRVGLHGAMPGRRGSGDRLLRANPKSGAVLGRKGRVLRSDGVGVQYPAGRGLRRTAEITGDHAGVAA
jgi:hypothetical protein